MSQIQCLKTSKSCSILSKSIDKTVAFIPSLWQSSKLNCIFFKWDRMNVENFPIKPSILCLVKFLQQDWQPRTSICKYRSSGLSWTQFQFGLAHLSFYSLISSSPLTLLLSMPPSPPTQHHPGQTQHPSWTSPLFWIFQWCRQSSTPGGQNSECLCPLTHLINIYWRSTLCQAFF